MTFLALLCLLAPLVQEPTSSVRPFQPLFDGATLEGWWGARTEDPRRLEGLSHAARAELQAASLHALHAHWRVEGDELVNDGQGPFLTTVREYGDFELELQWQIAAGGDSGVYVRGIPQVQIWDPDDEGNAAIGGARGSGGLWNNTAGAAGKDPLVRADRPVGEWNTFRILAVGERISVWLNGVLVVDHARLENYFERAAPLPRRGPIQLQTHGGETRWRQLRIRPLDVHEANRLLAARGNVGFTPLFDGVTLDGWEGALDGWEVEHGVLRCRAGHGGNLFTREAFADFVVRLEFRLPPGGNNGLALRYPGEGDPAYAGMCELQVLDDSHERYASLDPRQYHGSAYGLVASARGHQRAVGEWNVQEVTVVGHRATVELNGVRILDADLAAVAEGLAPLDRFAGRLRTSGRFGFAGHGDPVEFRAVRVRRIE